jgi:hypothetical protein
MWIDRVREPTVKCLRKGLSQYTNACLRRLLLQLLVGPQASGLHPFHFVDEIMDLLLRTDYQSDVKTTEYPDGGYATEDPGFYLV